MISDEVLKGLSDQVYRHTGVQIGEGKSTLLSSRIRRRVRALGLDSFEDYLALLESLDTAAEEVTEFIDVVTTHKTSFFRTRSVWDWLMGELKGDPERWRSLDMWSCASSTGQEPYSLAMVGDTIAAERPGFRWSLKATDVAAITVEQARAGSYPESMVNSAIAARPDILVKSQFDRAKDGEQEVKKLLRRKINFAQHNLLDPMRGRFDIAFCRNVLIYFSEEDKQRVVRNVISTLRPGGFLVIGESESLLARDLGINYLGPCVYQI